MLKKKILDNLFKYISLGCAITVFIIIAGVVAVLIVESVPAIKEFGFIKFIFSDTWDYRADKYGGAGPLTGTLLTTAGAVGIALPMSIGVAVFLTELCPERMKRMTGILIELLAAIPSIIYGMWGLFVLAPVLESTVQPLFAGTLGMLPLVGAFFKGGRGGLGLFTASVVLSVMIIPFIASIAKEAFNQVPGVLKESAYGIGATKWEMIKDVAIPYSKLSIAGGTILATGRALGETMAVTYVIGNRHGSFSSFFDPYTTITSVLASEFNESAGLQLSSLYLLALILFAVNLVIISCAKFVLRKTK